MYEGNERLAHGSPRGAANVRLIEMNDEDDDGRRGKRRNDESQSRTCSTFTTTRETNESLNITTSDDMIIITADLVCAASRSEQRINNDDTHLAIERCSGNQKGEEKKIDS